MFEKRPYSPADFAGKTIYEAFDDSYVDRFGDRYKAVFDGEEATT